MSEKSELNAQIESLKEREAELVAKSEAASTLEADLGKQLTTLNAGLESASGLNRELSASLQNSNDEIRRLTDELAQAKDEQIHALKENEGLSKRIEKLSNENEELTIERDDCEKMRLEAVKKHDMQLKAFNQNLANLRVELKGQNEKLGPLQQELNLVKGNNLELEAKLSNCMDERNQLLERCVNSEKMSETFKVQNVDLKRKLEDTQSALQELGREHQSLQVSIYSLKQINNGLSLQNLICIFL